MKLLLSVIALATVVASPSFAQAYDPEVGSGNTVTPPRGYYRTTNDYNRYLNDYLGNRGYMVLPGHRSHMVRQSGRRVATRQSGLDAFASVLNPNSPALTGGGSVGYNELLKPY